MNVYFNIFSELGFKLGVFPVECTVHLKLHCNLRRDKKLFQLNNSYLPTNSDLQLLTSLQLLREHVLQPEPAVLQRKQFWNAVIWELDDCAAVINKLHPRHYREEGHVPVLYLLRGIHWWNEREVNHSYQPMRKTLIQEPSGLHQLFRSRKYGQTLW